MTMEMVESAWLLWKCLAFRMMVADYTEGAPNWGRLNRLRRKAMERYYRRKAALGGQW